MGKTLDRIIQYAALRRWRTWAKQASSAPISTLRTQATAARQLRNHLNSFLHGAETKLALPRIGSTNFARPPGTDWSWRPELWRGPLHPAGAASAPSKTRLGTEVQLFHDCAYSELTLRQLRNTREEDLAPFGLRMDVFQFDGSFLSIVVDLPPGALVDLTRQHVFRVDCILESERPIGIFARLNIKHGPNTEQIVRELEIDQKSASAEYDLAHAKLNEKRMENAWLDLIFEAPDMNQVVIRDLTFSRHLRANL